MIATWRAINESLNVTATIFFTPNATISRNQKEVSTAILTFYNDSAKATALNVLNKQITIQFTLPSNDGPTLSSSSLSLTTNEDTSTTVNIWIKDSDFYQLNQAGNVMKLNITVKNGTMAFNSVNGLYFVLGNGTSSRSVSVYGDINSLNQSLNPLTYTPNPHFSGNDVIRVFIDDTSNSGTGGRKTDSLSISIPS